MTSDEYGTERNEFKGKRIKRIRMHEMEEAAKVYGTNPDGTPKLKLHWFGEIDGYLPFNKDVLSRLQRLILDLQPDVVFGPDSFFTLDYHVDHMRAGWLIYFAIKTLPLSKARHPLLFLYHSFNNNFFVPVKALSIQVSAWAKHRSQTTPLRNKLILPVRWLFNTFRRARTGSTLAEGFRRVRFVAGENVLGKVSQRTFYRLVTKVNNGYKRSFYTPTPDQLGL